MTVGGSVRWREVNEKWVGARKLFRVGGGQGEARAEGRLVAKVRNADERAGCRWTLTRRRSVGKGCCMMASRSRLLRG